MSDHTKVGQLRDGNDQRDAIHIAVAPVTAKGDLKPGDYIGFDGLEREMVSKKEPLLSVGIVDPFLTRPLRRGDKFWMFLHPNTITSLRHNWTHPAFEEDTRSPEQIRDIKASEVWLRDFLSSEGPSYERLMEALDNDGSSYDEDSEYGVRIDADYLTCIGTDAHGNIPDEFWDHVETVLGRRVKYRPSSFSCSC